MRINYCLPDGRIIAIPCDVCRMASTIDFQLASGRMVLAVIVPGQRLTMRHKRA